MDFKCLICQNSCQGEEDSGGEGWRRDFKVAFGLFCKLLGVGERSSGVRGGGGDGGDSQALAKLLEEFGGGLKAKADGSLGGGRGDKAADVSVRTCDLCTGSLREILKLERVIKDLQSSQLMHVNTLKRFLLMDQTSRLSEDLGTCPSDVEYWNVIRTQLISCLNQQSNPGKRKLPTVPPTDTKSASKKSPVMPCTVRIIRLNTDKLKTGKTSAVPKTTRPSPSGRQGHIQENMLKAASFLQATVSNEPDMDLQSEDSDGDYEPPASSPPQVKQEPPELSENEDHEPSFSKSISSSSTTGIVKDPKGHSIFSFPPNVYLYKCTIIQFIPSQRQHLCQEPNCPTPSIPGSFLDGSFLANLKTHVLTHHSSSYKLDTGTIRTCPLCPTAISGSQNHFRAHFLAEHTTCRRRGFDFCVCPVCGMSLMNCAVRPHLWSHKSEEDIKLALAAGELVPSGLKKRIAQIIMPEESTCLSISSETGTTTKVQRRARQSKLKATQFLRDCLRNTDNLPSPEKFQDIDNHEPPESSPAIKQEPVGPENIRVVKGSTLNNQGIRRGNSIFFLAPNVYLYKCTIIQFIPSEQQHLCQEPNCTTPSIPGTFLDGSLLKHLKCHVEDNHSLSNSVDEGLTRTCPLCPTLISGSQNDFRTHLLAQHAPDKRRGFERRLCLVCGVDLQIPALLPHVWRHKSKEEMKIALNTRDPDEIPWKVRNELKIRTVRKKKVVPKKRMRRASPENGKGTQYVPGLLYNDEIYLLENSTKLLFHYSVITVENGGCRLVCGDSGCGRVFQSEVVMDYTRVLNEVKCHVRECHRVEGTRECEECSGEFSNGAKFRKHLLTIHGKKEGKGKDPWVLCERCLKPLRKQMGKKHGWTHLSSEEKVKLYEKPEKLTLFTREMKARAEKIKEGNPEPEMVACEHCDKTFRSWGVLRAHLEIHVEREKRRKWTCEQCGVQLLSPRALRSHRERKHNRELIRWKVCPVEGCGKVFNAREGYRLKVHLRRHRGEKDAVCEVCGLGFTDKNRLKRHMLAHAPKVQCEICGKRYSALKGIQRHWRIAHKGQSKA